MTLSGSLPAASVGVRAELAKPSARKTQASQGDAATVKRRALIGGVSTPPAGGSGIAGPTDLCLRRRAKLGQGPTVALADGTQSTTRPDLRTGVTFATNNRASSIA